VRCVHFAPRCTYAHSRGVGTGAPADAHLPLTWLQTASCSASSLHLSLCYRCVAAGCTEDTHALYRGKKSSAHTLAGFAPTTSVGTASQDMGGARLYPPPLRA